MLKNLILFSSIVVVAMIGSVSYHPSQEAQTTNSVGSLQTVSEVTKPSVDQLAVASLTAKTAEVASLAVASEASNASISLGVKSELAQQDETVITKPQAFEPTSSGAIVTYKSVSGDTVQTVSRRYGVSDQTIKWANNLTTDIVVPDSELIVPTTDGVVYITKDGDTLESLASKYQSDKARIISKNDLELTGLVVGQRIVLPGGILPETERPGYVAPRTITRNTPTTSAPSTAVSRSNPAYAVQAGNRYSYGYCTWYAYNRRMQIGRPVGSFWGNASSWAYAAASAGYVVTRGNPGVGDVMQNGGGAGHVAVVEEKFPDGGIRVSEMNYYANGGGWNIISYRTLDAGAAASYAFIK